MISSKYLIEDFMSGLHAAAAAASFSAYLINLPGFPSPLQVSGYLGMLRIH